MNTESVTKGNWKFLVVLPVLLVGLMLAVETVQRNQENRNEAISQIFGSDELNICGTANGLSVLERPFFDLCISGSAIWIDSAVNDGEYRWQCVDEVTGKKDECRAFLEDQLLL